ncbi:MAG TPA: hypothetical protein VH370_08110 [Humisphaera sp.]|jgi:hypothetical protein|nr:hypothetical protein [Humisphaera sp.]
MSDSFDETGKAIAKILLEEWDPHDAARRDARGAYDVYVEPLAALIREGADEQAIVDWLHEREKETMCFPSLGTQRLRRIARLLLGVKRS